MVRKIDLEAHFLTESYLNYLRSRTSYPLVDCIRDERNVDFERIWYSQNICQSRNKETIEKLLDLGEQRFQSMKGSGVDMEVLSLCDPGCEQFEVEPAIAVAKSTNDELARVIKKNPDRFVGLAALAPQDPNWSADELERAVKMLGFRGAKIHSNVRGEYLDNKKYWIIFERAESLGVPIYLHPTIPSSSMIKPYTDDYGYYLAGPSLGFAAETALHALRLIYSGLFDQYPKLKMILGHGGEGLPFWLMRIDESCLQKSTLGELEVNCIYQPSYYIKRNFLMTTSGMFFPPSILCCYMALGADRMAFAADSPFQSEPNGWSIGNLPICDLDKEKIYYLNAEKVLGIRR
ncbi:amidohydrolase family protein [Chloroflexota bacterium]